MSSDDDYYFTTPPSQEFQDEINVRDRVIPGIGFFGSLSQNRVERAMMDPLDRFREYVNAIAYDLNNSGDINISGSIEFMLETAEKLKYVGYKNPTAYILGFIVTNGGKGLEKTKFDKIKKILSNEKVIKDDSVLPQDIIRYARLWERELYIPNLE